MRLQGKEGSALRKVPQRMSHHPATGRAARGARRGCARWSAGTVGSERSSVHSHLAREIKRDELMQRADEQPGSTDVTARELGRAGALQASMAVTLDSSAAERTPQPEPQRPHGARCRLCAQHAKMSLGASAERKSAPVAVSGRLERY